jgi:hypothetical protein
MDRWAFAATVAATAIAVELMLEKPKKAYNVTLLSHFSYLSLRLAL